MKSGRKKKRKAFFWLVKGKENIWCHIALCAYLLFQSSYLIQICKLEQTKQCICHNFILICNDIFFFFWLRKNV